ncbi:MAG: M15 family metallopeptidase [Thermoanaerobaculia bacterium]|nr:M15 family metallopeptidase [Thermoanaerobaculia bacterium]
MRLFYLFQVAVLGLLLAVAGCGPEAETGALFARSGLAHEGGGGMTTDTTDPRKDKMTDREIMAVEAPESGAPDQPDKEVDLNYLMGKFDPARHPDFVPVGKPYTHKPGMMLRRETFAAFKKMWAAAKKDGVTLTIISSTRSFEQQKNIWEGKWSRFAAEHPQADARARKILEYSAMPGASRHHWGTDIDLNDLNNPSFEPGGRHVNVYAWLKVHAYEFGFCQPYTAKGDQRPHGYNEEKWHWSYLPLAMPLLRQYSEAVRDEMLRGFSGAETAKPLHMVDHYALGINQDCKPR